MSAFRSQIRKGAINTFLFLFKAGIFLVQALFDVQNPLAQKNYAKVTQTSENQNERQFYKETYFKRATPVLVVQIHQINSVIYTFEESGKGYN